MKGLKHTLRNALIVVPFLSLMLLEGKGQSYTAAQVFAHNDYKREAPFFTAYDLGVGYIEADVFLHRDELVVAHEKDEINLMNTLEGLYLEPLLRAVQKNNGSAYPDPDVHLTLMIDLKSEGDSTLGRIVEVLDRYPMLIDCPSLQFMISGNVPAPETWRRYPSHIHFDGRPGIPYTTAQLKRITMISTGFGQHIRWNGTDPLPGDAEMKINELIREAHSRGKKFRFWGTPDTESAWKKFMDLKMDVIVTDKVTEAVKFLEESR